MFFHLAVQFSKYIQLSQAFAYRSLKTIQVQEEEQSFDLPWQDFFASFGFYQLSLIHKLTYVGLYRPGMNESVSFFVLSLERR